MCIGKDIHGQGNKFQDVKMMTKHRFSAMTLTYQLFDGLLNYDGATMFHRVYINMINTT